MRRSADFHTEALSVAQRGGRVALILGAGGAKGFAYHAGILAAIEQSWSWSPNEAARIIGTSAGSVTGALIRQGLSTKDLWASAVGSPERDSVAAQTLRIPPPIDIDLSLSWKSIRMPKRNDLRRLAQLAAHGPMTFGALGLLRNGHHDFEKEVDFLGDEWSNQPLELVTVRTDIGTRIVLTRSSNVSLSKAVAASCAVPSIMRPVEISDYSHVDGAVASPTNADVAANDQSLDAVIVISPMSGDSANTVIGKASLWQARTCLESERRLFKEIPVSVFSPSGRVSEMIIDSTSARTDYHQIVNDAFESIDASARVQV